MPSSPGDLQEPLHGQRSYHPLTCHREQSRSALQATPSSLSDLLELEQEQNKHIYKNNLSSKVTGICLSGASRFFEPCIAAVDNQFRSSELTVSACCFMWKIAYFTYLKNKGA